MTKKTTRVILDVLLTVMIVFEMFIQYTGDFLHEVIGLVFFLTIAAHLALSATWLRNTARAAQTGTLTGRRTVLAVMGCLLAIATIVLGVSSVAISNLLADAGFVWALGSYSLWVVVHTISSYALCALVVVHLGMHWAFLASAFKVPYNPARRQAIGAGVQAVAAIGAVALGVTAMREVAPIATLTGEENAQERTTENSNATEENVGRHGHGNKHGYGNGSGIQQGRGNGLGSGGNGSGSGNSNDSGDSSSTTGVCTLCRKYCPLSAPRCNRPYEAGLL